MSATEWSDVLGNYLTRQQVYDWYVQEHREGESCAEWIERMSVELWGTEHDPDLNWSAMATDIMAAEATE